jgi:hypothetical protein
MLTDKPAIYRTEIIEPAKRTLPVLFTVPGQVYDVDPTRSMELKRVDSELSGDAHRIFDGSIESPYNLFALEVSKSYEERINFSDLGIDEKKEYLVFEYWSKKFIGVFQSGFEPGQIDPKYNCQLFCIREKQGHPQLIATSRHISCGGYETETLTWQNDRLKGISKLTANDPFMLYVTEVAGYEFINWEFRGAQLISSNVENGIRSFTLKAEKAGPLEWSIDYKQTGGSL